MAVPCEETANLVFSYSIISSGEGKIKISLLIFRLFVYVLLVISF